MTEGTEVTFHARIQTQQRLPPGRDSLIFRDQTGSIQGALAHTAPHLVEWVEQRSYPDWSSVTGGLARGFCLDETPIIPLTEALQMLRNDGRDIEGEDLSTRDELRLGELVKQKYMTDYYILDKLPAHTRPFYTNRAKGTQWANPFNIFLRGRWICTGGQRIHDEQNIPKSTEHAQITGRQVGIYHRIRPRRANSRGCKPQFGASRRDPS
ncbi:hypothetical protein BKA60DRAFT_638692 [Fusarium oxysporum]|nr:hypothetical protein BKA60DRAFT_638692 [Fusarium oxysporum]